VPAAEALSQRVELATAMENVLKVVRDNLADGPIVEVD
jgi:hypothetical protein